MYKIKHWFNRVKRAFKWFFIIYNQPLYREYNSYIDTNIILLQEMAEWFEDKDYTTSAKKDAKQMRVAAEWLKRYKDEYYASQFSEKYPIDWIEDNNSRHMIIKSTINSIKENEYWYKWLKESEAKNNNALQEAFKIISKNLSQWWM